MIPLRLTIVLIIAYLLGSIPCGLIIGKLRKGIDIRQYGSGKTGGTNVMRTTGAKLGILTLLIDGFKAGLAVMLAKEIIGNTSIVVGNIFINWQVAQTMAGVAAIAGHNWPIFAQFRGGRGVASYFGTMFIMSPLAATCGVVVLIILARHTRHMSTGSIFGAISSWCLTLILTLGYGDPIPYLIYSSVIVLLIIYQHKDNISRLRQGTERRL
jgi:acyl phosphate:glycerol-3-phosphate acyltransferase